MQDWQHTHALLTRPRGSILQPTLQVLRQECAPVPEHTSSRNVEALYLR